MVVFDSSTLILLARTELLDRFLGAAKLKIVVPREVERECCEERETLDGLLIQRAITEKKITVRFLKEKKVYEKIRRDFTLGVGEAEAIALALSEKAELVATDDKKAINACKLLKITLTTAVAILVRMYEKGALEQEEALGKLEALQKYGRYKKAIIADARSKLEVR